MRAVLLALWASASVMLAGCNQRPAVDYAPSVPLRELMQSVVEPNADAIWDSFAIIITAKGEEHKMPRSDEEWQVVRNHAVALVEAANLLLIPNRPVARPGQGADNPDVERDPKEIEAMITRDRARFLNRVAAFREEATKMLAAVDARDLRAIEAAGETLDVACENCHETYWYLPDK